MDLLESKKLEIMNYTAIIIMRSKDDGIRTAAFIALDHLLSNKTIKDLEDQHINNLPPRLLLSYVDYAMAINSNNSDHISKIKNIANKKMRDGDLGDIDLITKKRIKRDE